MQALPVPGWGHSPMVSSCEDSNKLPGYTWGDIYLVVVSTLSLKSLLQRSGYSLTQAQQNKHCSWSVTNSRGNTYLVLLYLCKLLWTFWKEKSQNLLQMNHSTSLWIKTSIYTNIFQHKSAYQSQLWTPKCSNLNKLTFRLKCDFILSSFSQSKCIFAL